MALIRDWEPRDWEPGHLGKFIFIQFYSHKFDGMLTLFCCFMVWSTGTNDDGVIAIDSFYGPQSGFARPACFPQPKLKDWWKNKTEPESNKRKWKRRQSQGGPCTMESTGFPGTASVSVPYRPLVKLKKWYPRSTEQAGWVAGEAWKPRWSIAGTWRFGLLLHPMVEATMRSCLRSRFLPSLLLQLLFRPLRDDSSAGNQASKEEEESSWPDQWFIGYGTIGSNASGISPCYCTWRRDAAEGSLAYLNKMWLHYNVFSVKLFYWM